MSLPPMSYVNIISHKTLEYVQYVIYDVCYEYIDLSYLQFLTWVFYPLVITFILPAFLLLFIYASILFLHIYKLRHHLRDVYSRREFWDGARHSLAAVWEAQGKIWHGYEVVGMEKIPSTGAAMIVGYHGAIPIDFYYLMAKCILKQNRQIRCVGDKFLFKLPGFKLLMEVFCVLPGTVTGGVDILKEGHLLAIFPGGVREAYFSDEYYQMLWGKRLGFAKIAIQAQVPIIPFFTRNCREAFRALSTGRKWLRRIYEYTRLPIVPIYGGFPVKMKTYIGDPVYPEPEHTPEQLAQKVQSSIQGLIDEHQIIPGSIVRGLTERFYTPKPHKLKTQ